GVAAAAGFLTRAFSGNIRTAGTRAGGAAAGLHAAAGGLGAIARMAGAAGLALGGVLLALDQAEKLKKESGGLGVWDIAEGMFKVGTWDPFEIVDAHQNKQAIDR